MEQKNPSEIESESADPQETQEWVEAFNQLVQYHGEERARYILDRILTLAQRGRLKLPEIIQTPYLNTISVEEEPPYPGDERIEARIRAILRWNAAVMVHRANHHSPGIGGHISTYSSVATMYEVGFNHFFRGKDNGEPGDQIFFQGHASPGIYARAFLMGQLTEGHLERFRRETAGGGLSSYPHPWLMPGFWEFPTVSMGLGPLTAIYQARFNRYMRDRGIRNTDGSRVWCFLGDGECDEPESLGSLSLAGREGLDNLIFIVNCNLQRLDGPVRGNGKIIQELETVFRGSGWNVVKVITGRDFDPLLAADTDGLLAQRMNEAVDGDYQRYSTDSSGYTRRHFFGKYPKLLKLVEHLTDEQIMLMRRGGHDSVKLYAAYHHAVHKAKGRPTVILAKTVKGWTLGEGAQGTNVSHQHKKFTESQLRKFRDILQLPIPDAQLADPPYYKPPPDSEEMRYMLDCRRRLGGTVPRRTVRAPKETLPPLSTFADELAGSTVEAATTKTFDKILGDLMKDANIGRRIVPIIPDEARTFGLDVLFRKFGIYSSVGQKYEPVDSHLLLSYREAKDGQVLEEGITEAGSLATWTAAGTAYATHGVNMVPFFIFYSMFGFQRVGDLIWAAADARARGFLIGATAGRTTLNGEGLQHEDGHSHILASVVPTIRAYDPAWGYEVAVIIHDGLRRMYEEQESCFYYITVYNEPYAQPPMPPGVEEGIIRGLYRFRTASTQGPRAQILGSGTLMREALRAQEILEKKFGVAADVWSATSYLTLRRESMEAERWNLLHPQAEPRVSHLQRTLGQAPGPVVAVSDFMRAVPDQIARWIPGRFLPLGTDGFGRSDTRTALRRHFEIDAEHVAYAVLSMLARDGAFARDRLSPAMGELGLDPDAPDPSRA
jgi:pyruvate dehydrogenase E1 component